VNAGPLLVTQYLPTAVAIRRKARSPASPRTARSAAPASRSVSVVAASDSSARSARTLRIRGCSASREPKAVRCRAWWPASTRVLRISAADAVTQSRRVQLTISMMVFTPCPSGPTSQPSVPSNSGSEDALERLPSLSLRRWTRNGLRVPSGRTRGTRKQDSPPGACASTRKTSHIGADVNHLCPRSTYTPGSAVGAADVVFVRTSEPPCFSVMPMPARTPRFPVGTRRPGSYSRAVSSGSYTFARSGWWRRAGTAAYVIDTGQPWPASVWFHTRLPAVRATCAPGRSFAHAEPARPSVTATSIRACQLGWKSTSSTRCP